MASKTPEVDWEALAKCTWQRKKWREGDDVERFCCVYGTPIHREGTYYLRPAYTDGQRWMSAKAYRELCLRLGIRFTNRYSHTQKSPPTD